jgi:hypothetical protein
MRFQIIAFSLCIFFIPTVMFIFRIMSEDFKGRTAFSGLALQNANKADVSRQLSSSSSRAASVGSNLSPKEASPSSIQVVDDMMAQGREKEASRSYVSTSTSDLSMQTTHLSDMFPQFVWKMCKHFGWERSIIEDKAPRIFSGALFGGEFDVLEIVLREGKGLIHTHVIVENNVTVSNDTKHTCSVAIVHIKSQVRGQKLCSGTYTFMHANAPYLIALEGCFLSVCRNQKPKTI